jgi:protein O-GlcNAc transferase
LLRAHERKRFQIYVYQQYNQPYVGTPRLKALADDWRATFDIDDVTFSHIVANDGIDVIVDLCGCSPGHRQTYLASGERPLSVGWLSPPHGGTAATTDHVFADSVTMASEAGLAMGLPCYDLGESLVAYGGGDVKLDVVGGKNLEQYEIAAGSEVTFGAALDLSRIVSSAELWANVLKAIDGARLVLGDVDVVHAETVAQIGKIFTGLGVGERVDCLTKPTKHSARAELISRIDVLLDCRFVNGGGLICDALWMGVPVVSLTGSWKAGRFGTSILTSAGRSHWATDDDQGFVSIARILAEDRSKLASLRKTLRRETQASALCDTDGFAKRVEAAYQALLGRA